MNTYLICFEIDKDETKTLFTKALMSYGNYCPISQTAWAIKTENDASQILNRLSIILDANDRLFVLRSGTEAAWQNSYGTKHDEWLKVNL